MTRHDPTYNPLPPTDQDTGLTVEFFGLPGSGKTTIAREVHALLARKHSGMVLASDILCDDAGLVPRAQRKLRLIFAGLGDGVTIPAARRAFTFRQARLRDKLRAASTLATVTALYTHMRRRRLQAVLDQGMLQALWSVQLRATSGDVSALMELVLMDAAKSGRIHVSVETPTRVCAERLASRASKHSRMQTSGATKDPQAWETAELLRRSVLGSLRAAYRKQGIAPLIIVVDGTADPATAARQIMATLDRANSNHAFPPSNHLREILV